MSVGSTALLLATLATAAGDLEDGITLYENKDYAGALAAFGRAGAQPQTPRRRATIHLYIGILQYRFGLEDDARNSFEESLDHHAGIPFPDASASGAQRMYDALKAELVEEEEPKSKPKKRRRRRRRKKPDPPPVVQDVGEVQEPPVVEPPPPPIVEPPPPVVVVAPTPEAPEPSIAPWVVAGGGVVAAIAGTTLVLVGRANGRAAQEPDRNALDAESLYDTHRVQVGVGVGALVVAGVAAGVATYLFATD